MTMKKSIFSLLIAFGFIINNPLAGIPRPISATHYFTITAIDDNCAIPEEKIADMIEKTERLFGGTITSYAYMISKLASDSSKCNCRVFFVKGNSKESLESMVNQNGLSFALETGLIENAIINWDKQK